MSEEISQSDQDDIDDQWIDDFFVDRGFKRVPPKDVMPLLDSIFGDKDKSEPESCGVRRLADQEAPVSTPYGDLTRDDEDWFFSPND